MAWLRTSPTLGKAADFPRAPVHGKPGKGFDYHFLSFEAGTEPEVLETDVIVVGSSCGGAVVAKNLAEDGHRVIVVDKGYYFTPEHLPMTEINAGFNLFESGGVINTDDNSVSIIAGAGWGGGGTVNWSASLQTQGFVRKEWADSGLKFFETPGFQKSLDRVYDRMGVSTEHIKHNVPNIKLAEATRQLGWAIRDLPQNTGGNQHYCGYCTLGCGAVEKQGPIVSWLPDAVKAGAQTIEGLKVNEIIFENREGKKTAVGVRGQWTSRDGEGKLLGPDRVTREVIIKAKRVVISAGTLWSPLLLLKSGLKVSTGIFKRYVLSQFQADPTLMKCVTSNSTNGLRAYKVLLISRASARDISDISLCECLPIFQVISRCMGNISFHKQVSSDAVFLHMSNKSRVLIICKTSHSVNVLSFNRQAPVT